MKIITGKERTNLKVNFSFIEGRVKQKEIINKIFVNLPMYEEDSIKCQVAVFNRVTYFWLWKGYL